MKLQSSAAAQYPKFNVQGDKISGAFVQFEEAKPGKFGPENLLTLDGADGYMIVRCPAVLHGILKDNLKHLTPGRQVTITYTGSRPSGKGNPMKLFDVELDSAPHTPQHADDIPF